MRSRMAWAIFLFVVVLIVIALMSFNLTALHEPGPVETRVANLSKTIAAYVMPTMADHNELRGCGCTRAHPSP